MPNTLPEGVTPTPVLAEQSMRYGARPSFLVTASVVLGLILTCGIILGFTGKTVYVERTEFTQKNEQDVREKVQLSEGLKSISARLDRQDSSLSKLDVNLERLAGDLQAMKVDIARWRSR